MQTFLKREDFTTESEGMQFADGGEFTFSYSSPTRATAVLDPVESAVIKSVSVELTAAAASATGSEYVKIQNTVKRFAYRERLQGQRVQVSIDPQSPITIDIKSATSGWTSDRCAAKVILDYAAREGTARLELLAYTPLDTLNSAVLGKAIIGAFRLPKPETYSTHFRIGESRISGGVLRPAGATHVWKSILGPATVVEINRGIQYNGFAGRAEIGTLVANFFNALDPRSANLWPGMPIVAFDTGSRRRLFTGRLARTLSNPAKDGTYTVQIEARDILADIAAVTKYQETSPKPRGWQNLLANLTDGFTWNHTRNSDVVPPQIGSIVKQSTLVDYIDMICATVGVTWWAGLHGEIRSIDTPNTTPIAAVSMGEGAPSTLPKISPVEVDAAADSENVIATLTAVNNSAGINEQSEWQGTTSTISVTNTTLAATYGSRSVQIETAAADIAVLQEFIHGFLAAYQPQQVMKTAKFRPVDERARAYDYAALETLATLEILDPVFVRYRGSSATAHITSIRHSITPESWETTYEFTQWKGLENDRQVG
ncbi:hypothetical protein [Arcanobacterium canis]